MKKKLKSLEEKIYIILCDIHCKYLLSILTYLFPTYIFDIKHN